MTDFQDVRAVVTGAASGLGAALARALAARGARVAIADLAEGEALATADTIGSGARGYRCDVCERVEVEALAQAVVRDFGGADLVFANAGVFVGGSLMNIQSSEFDWLFDVNVRGVFHTVQAFAPLLLQRAGNGRRPRFVITGSENSVGLPLKGVMTAYTATKHALLALADGLRRDLADSGVGVSILCPGAVNTRLWDARRARPMRYGGAAREEAAVAAAAARTFAAIGQDPDLTARLCLEGVANDEFLIITHANIREFALKRHQEVEAALDRLEVRLKGGPE
ncbi:MAG TPA: SDR family NAD(P)-dependent oxidoreductase [Caulobacteraceae bacterium]|nr:SDR family NAD(P)-dependent oxidoreductase [Caulobacteraceae bacterium]